jgi:hypothetical protein
LLDLETNDIRWPGHNRLILHFIGIECDRLHVAPQYMKRGSVVVTESFGKWARGFSGCDGGNPFGDIWLCGIEYAGGEDEQSIRQHLTQDVSNPPPPREDHASYLESRYNKSALKMLCALAGESVGCYKEFFRANDVFGEKSRYFKLNLYPIGFKNISGSQWEVWHPRLTGFQNKKDYLIWCQKERFPEMKGWARKYSPKLIVCTGTTYTDEFFDAFCDCTDTEIQDAQGIPGNPIRYTLANARRTLVAVTYFLGGANGLNSKEKLSATGQRLAHLLRDHGLA